MCVKSASNEELQRMHFEALLGIVHDFLCWGGFPQADFAKRSLDELARRVEVRESTVRKNDKILAVI